MTELFLIAHVAGRGVAIPADRVDSVVDIDDIVRVPRADPAVRALALNGREIRNALQTAVALAENDSQSEGRKGQRQGAGEGEAEELGNRYQMIFAWTMLSPSSFTALLAAMRPEALVVLAYYALLLHYGRGMWQVGDAGAYILGMIVDYLQPEWRRWLEYPGERIARSLE